jgi:anti-sigma factor RsiW
VTTSCAQRSRLQSYLDGELAAAESADLRAHLTACPECAAELALYERLVATLEAAPLLEPQPALRGRILERVLPSRTRRRHRIAALGGAYAGAFSVLAAVFALWATQPAGRVALETIGGRLSHQLLGLGLSAFNLLGASAVRLAQGWGLARALGGWLAPLSRALATVMMEPEIVVTVWAAMAVCVALLWWMRPRTRTAAREVRHVGIVGF